MAVLHSSSSSKVGIWIIYLLLEFLVDSCCGLSTCVAAASPNHSSYSLHLPVSKINSLLLSSVLHCPLPCTVCIRALALATCLTAAVKIHMDDWDPLLWEWKNRHKFWRHPSGNEDGLWGWRPLEVSPTDSHKTSNLSLLQFLSSGIWKLPLFSGSCWLVLSTALLDLPTSCKPPCTPKISFQ